MPDTQTSTLPTSQAAPLGVADPSPGEAIVDDAQNAASQIRQIARWVASALAGIPALAIVASLIKGPGSGGYDEKQLIAGLVLAALGAYAGILAFAWVLVPIALEDKALKTVRMSRLPGQPFATFGDLLDQLTLTRRKAAWAQYRSMSDKVFASIAETVAAERDVLAVEAETASKADPNNDALTKAATVARTAATSARDESIARKATSAGSEQVAMLWVGQVRAMEKIRGQVMRLKASDEVGFRYMVMQWIVVLAVLAVAVGIGLVALAPIEKASSSTTASAARAASSSHSP